MLTEIQIKNLRIIKHEIIKLNPRVNIFFGKNGSGKSSLVEAVSILTRGKSYRTNNLNSVINQNEDYFLVSGKLFVNSTLNRIGVEKSNSGMRIRINESNIRSLSKLAEVIPIQIIDSENIRLIQSGPSSKRKFINWLCFHYADSYRDAWIRYNKALKQINTIFKTRKITSLRSWYSEAAYSAGVLHHYRSKLVVSLNQTLKENFSGWFTNNEIQIFYKKGWAENTDFHDALKESERRNIVNEVLTIGPHRANFIIKVDDKEASAVLSKGQLKLLSIALLMCQVDILLSQKKLKPIFLIDDLVSELDVNNVSLVLEKLFAMNIQTLITTIDHSLVPTDFDGDKVSRFLVDAGVITEVKSTDI